MYKFSSIAWPQLFKLKDCHTDLEMSLNRYKRMFKHITQWKIKFIIWTNTLRESKNKSQKGRNNTKPFLILKWTKITQPTSHKYPKFYKSSELILNQQTHLILYNKYQTSACPLLKSSLSKFKNPFLPFRSSAVMSLTIYFLIWPKYLWK